MGTEDPWESLALPKGIGFMNKELTLEIIAQMIAGNIKGDPGYVVSSISSPEKPSAGSICPLWEKQLLPFVREEAVLLTKYGWIIEGGHGIEVEDPRRALIKILELFDPSTADNAPIIHSAAIVSDSSVIGREVSIGPGCVISDGAVIGDNSVLIGNIWVGRDAKIGTGSLIEPGVVIYDRISVGNRCIVHANAVIGSDGFGFMPDTEAGLLRIPQIGTVVIEDDVEIGAFTSIDRATFGETLVSRGTKIDSHVKIGHNCHIGEFCIIVGQTGLAGSSYLGKGVILAAQSGVSNHAHVGDGVTAAGRAGICSDIPQGQTVSGFPARDHRQELRQIAAMRHLPDLVKNIKDINARVVKLELKQ